MINYQSIIELLLSDKYVDKTRNFELFWGFSHLTLVNCKGTGSSLFLKTFACFLDERADSKEVFRYLAIGKLGEYDKHVNAYRVLYLDFSDFDAKCFKDAKEHIRRMMADAYKFFSTCFEPKSGYLYDVSSFEQALDMIEGQASDEVLQSSLRLLILQLRGYETSRTDKKLAVLIDNMVQLETSAAKYGYSIEMNKFLESFLVADVYKYCDIFLQISDQPEERDSWFSRDNHLVYRYFCVSYLDMRERFAEMVVPSDSQFHFVVSPYTPPPFDWYAYIENGHQTVRQARYEEEQKRLEHIRYEKERYAKDLSPDIPKFSPNMGVRRKSLNKDSRKYKELNALVVDVYKKFNPDFNADKIYGYFQKIEENERLVSNRRALEKALEGLPEKYLNWKERGVVSNSGSWIQVIYSRLDKQSDSSPAKPEGLKVYACLRGTNVKEVFVESLRYLLQHTDETFAAKIATCNRSDQMCYWVSHRGFQLLEDFYRPYRNRLVESLSFVAYRNHLGISKEFFGMDYSHNATIAHIIADYLKTVNDVTDVDLEDMFNNYIMKWNGDIYEEESYSGFKNNSAHSFVVILDSLDAILGQTRITDNHPLISGDRHIWRVLSECRCWADVNEKYYEYQ